MQEKDVDNVRCERILYAYVNTFGQQQHQEQQQICHGKFNINQNVNDATGTYCVYILAIYIFVFCSGTIQNKRMETWRVSLIL